jgi:hypothetical protein
MGLIMSVLLDLIVIKSLPVICSNLMDQDYVLLDPILIKISVCDLFKNRVEQDYVCSFGSDNDQISICDSFKSDGPGDYVCFFWMW